MADHAFLIDAGWSEQVVNNAKRHLGFGLNFASESVMLKTESANHQLKGKQIDCISDTNTFCRQRDLQNYGK